MGGKPSSGTKKDRRLKANRTSTSKTSKTSRTGLGGKRLK